MVDFMVEDLVEKDMAPWVDFEAEYFETGIDVEEQILSSIMDDVLVVYHCHLHCGWCLSSSLIKSQYLF